MAFSIDYAGSFKKDYKRLKKRGLPLDKLKEAIQILVETGALPMEYRPHKLTGIMSVNGNAISMVVIAIGSWCGNKTTLH